MAELGEGKDQRLVSAGGLQSEEDVPETAHCDGSSSIDCAEG